ncbi:MAG: hypothetical protein HVK34_02875 [Pelagibacteraceae bacterium]|nr:hypothetical protein [Pelagibacteraceae bacterium]MBO6488562.1 hypothetical protein [Pelagibacteraceae bacterium]
MSSEISEKVKLIDLLKKNFKLLLSLSILLFVIISILLWFDHSNKSKREKISEDFIQAKILLENQQNIKAHNVLKNIIEKKDNIYSPLSLFLIIEKNLETDKATITNYFDKILDIGSIEKEDLNLLRLKKAIFISENSKEEDMLELLNPIINSDSVWKIQSIKFLGDYYFSLKQFNKAKQYYLILISDNDIGLDKNEIKRKLNIIGDE